MTNYDIIGDVHGHADALSALLGKMAMCTSEASR